MKYTKFAIVACSTILASGQGLYNLSNLYALEEESSPLTYTIGVRVGYDDNVNPIGSDLPGRDEEGATFISGDIRAGWSHSESNYSLSLWGKLGTIIYLDDLDDVEGDLDTATPIYSGGLDFRYDFNDRIRFNSRNYIFFGLEPDYDRGIANDRRAEEYFAYSSNNDIGIRWSERFGTVHGIGFSGADYDNGFDFNTFSFYNQARYVLSPRTVLTAGYTFGTRSGSGANAAGDSDTHTFTVGAEHQLSDRTGITVRGGFTTLEQDSGFANGFSSDSFFFNGSFRHAVSDRFSLTGFVSYDQDDRFTTVQTELTDGTLGFTPFGARENLRIGIRGNYRVSQSLSLFGGLDLIRSLYEGPRGAIGGPIQGIALNPLVSVATTDANGNPLTTNVDDASALIYNLNAGFRYHISNNFSVVGSYNFTNSSSDELTPFEYTRNRYSIGVEASF